MRLKSIGVTVAASLTMMMSMLVVSAADTTSVAVSEANFPDAVFREYVGTNFDSDGDGVLSETELGNVTSINVRKTDVANLTGVGYFQNLKYLYCHGTDITSLDVSKNTALQELNCSNTKITSLDVSKNALLARLDCSNTKITSLDVSNNPLLESLYCNNTGLTELDLSANPNITALSYGYTGIKDLDYSMYTDLVVLDCSGMDYITNFDASKFPKLQTLRLADTGITSLDLSTNTALRILDCSNTKIASLDVSKNPLLEALYCSNTGIKELDLSGLENLRSLRCQGTAITALDITNNPEIYQLYVSLGDINCVYGFENIKGFDVTKASDWQGATYADGKISGFDGRYSDKIGYNIRFTYTTTNGKVGSCRFYYNDVKHDYADNVCVDCGLIDISVTLDADNFPDEVFRNYIASNFDKDADGILSTSEINSIKTIRVNSKDITSLKGIENFTSLTYLDCARNEGLTSLDVSKNTELESLYCYGTGITSLDVSKNTALTELHCYNNEIYRLDLTNNTELVNLNCRSTGIRNLNLGNNAKLKYLDCSSTEITELDLSNNPDILRLYYGNTAIANYDISQFPNLQALGCYGTDTTILDVSKHTALTTLDCSDTLITSLDVSNNTELTSLSYSNTALANLDISKNTKLTYLNCSYTDTTGLDLVKYPELRSLYCSNTLITSLDISKNTALQRLECVGTKVDKFDISNNPNITYMRVSVGKIGCKYDFGNIIGFDPAKVTSWSGATYADGKVSDYTSDTIWGYYDATIDGRNQRVNVYFLPTSTGHKYVDGVCPECGDIEGYGEVEFGKLWSDDSIGHAMFKLDIATDDEEVYHISYKINDADGNQVGTMEVRFGHDSHILTNLYLNGDNKAKGVSWSRTNKNGSTYMGIELDNWKNYFPGEKYSYTFEKELLADIPSVETVDWDADSKPGVISWSPVDNADYYYAELYKDGKMVRGASGTSRTYYDFSSYINESGTYTVKVKSIGDMMLGDGEYVEGETSYVYVKPEEELIGTSKIWWTSREGSELPGIINWNPVAGASGYEVILYRYRPEYDRYDYSRTTGYNTDSQMFTSYDWTNTIKNWNERYNNGEPFDNYYCTIRALAGDIEVVANSSEEDAVRSGDYILAAAKEEEIKKALENTSAETVIKDIASAGIEDMAEAMQNDKEVLAKIETLEEEYAAANNVEVKEPEVTHEELKNAEIKVVGAGLNVTSGSAVQLKLNDVLEEDKKDINEKLYENTVQINITLNEGEEKVEGELKAPVTITMTPPARVDIDKMVILHYHGNGKMDTIYPIINDDGTVTFSVTSFSTFVFANIVEYDEGIEVPDTPAPKPPVTPTPPAIDVPDPEPDDDDDYDYSYDPKETIEDRFAGKAGWQKVNGAWYYFNSNGKLDTGWVQDTDGKWYYMDKETGKMQTEWVCSPNTKLWYYMDPVNGDMKSNGWICDPASGLWYYLDVNGAMCTGWIVVDGMWYLLDTNGAMCSGWNLVDGVWYLLGSDGAMRTGWQTVDGKEYYLDENGKCLMNTTTPDGFVVDANGAKVNN